MERKSHKSGVKVFPIQRPSSVFWIFLSILSKNSVPSRESCRPLSRFKDKKKRWNWLSLRSSELGLGQIHAALSVAEVIPILSSTTCSIVRGQRSFASRHQSPYTARNLAPATVQRLSFITASIASTAAIEYVSSVFRPAHSSCRKHFLSRFQLDLEFGLPKLTASVRSTESKAGIPRASRLPCALSHSTFQRRAKQ